MGVSLDVFSGIPNSPRIICRRPATATSTMPVGVGRQAWPVSVPSAAMSRWYLLWMDEILHHFETMGNHNLLVFLGESSIQGFLGGGLVHPQYGQNSGIRGRAGKGRGAGGGSDLRCFLLFVFVFFRKEWRTIVSREPGFQKRLSESLMCRFVFRISAPVGVELKGNQSDNQHLLGST